MTATVEAPVRDEHMPDWADDPQDVEDLTWMRDGPDYESRCVARERGPISIEMVQYRYPDGRVTNKAAIPHVDPWMWLEDEDPSDMVSELREIASQAYEAADILLGIHNLQPSPDMRSTGANLGYTEHVAAKNVRRLFKAQGYEQNEFAVSIGYGPSDFSQLMCGRLRWDLNDVERMAHVLGVEPFELLQEVER